MKIEKIKEEKKKGKLVLRMSDCSEIFANTIRRMILEEVPTLAVEDVEIKDNNSALYDEMLALRLGLLPIHTDLSSYRLPKNEDEVTEKSVQCTLQIKLKVAKKGLVLASDAESADPKCTFVQGDMPIVKLLSKQKVDLTLTAVMGQGKEHIKWSPGWGYYKKEAKIKLGTVKNPEMIAKASSDGVFTMKAGKLTINEEKVNKSQLMDFYESLDDGITITYGPELIFNLESWGQLSCKEMLTKSAEMLVEKAEILEAQL